MLPYIGEFFGSMILILLGDSVVANVNLNKSGHKGGGSVQCGIAWGLAVMIPAYIFGEASGAHFNPAMTLALAIDGSFSWSMVPGYIIAQFAGFFVGAVLVYLLFKDHLDATEDPNTILGVFATAPSIPNKGRNFLSELIGAFMLVFAVKGMDNVVGIAGGVNRLFLFGIITAGVMSFGGLTGFAINPARDISPRLVHAIFPIKNKGSSNWGYAVIPLFGPIVGGVLAILLFNAIPW